MKGELAKYSKYELASWIREFVTNPRPSPESIVPNIIILVRFLSIRSLASHSALDL